MAKTTLLKKLQSVKWGQVTVERTFTMTPVSPITGSHNVSSAAAVSVAKLGPSC